MRQTLRALNKLGIAGLPAGLSLLVVVAAVAAPTVGLSASDATVGETIDATADLTESPGATGEISFEVFGPDDPSCLGPALTPAPEPATVAGEGQYTSGPFTPTEAGVYRWSAHYSGDSENAAADSVCSASSVVAKAEPGLAGSASSAALGTAIHDEAAVTGGSSPTGEVTFRVYGPSDTTCLTPLKTDVVEIEGGHAVSGNFTPLQAGEFRWTASYSGDANNEPASLACNAPNQSSTVGKASPSLSGVATATVTVGSTITDSATLSGGFEADGQLTFRAYGPADATCGGAVKYEANVAVDGNGPYSPAGFAPAAGEYRWTVSYSGDADNEAASLGCNAMSQTSTVDKASPGLSGVATPSATVGATITDSATLSGGFQPGGQLTFRAYGPGDADCSGAVKYEASVAVSGNGAYSPAGFSPPAGLYRWTVSYSGDEDNGPATLACNSANQTSTVGKASPGLSGNATATVTVGSTITDTATLSGGFQPGGQLTFRAYGPADAGCGGPVRYEASVTVSGNGPYSPAGFSPSTAGVYRWTVSYSGDEGNGPATLACNSTNQSSTVAQAAPGLSGNATASATVGATITDTATLSGGFQPGGQLTFRAYGPGDADCSEAVKYEASVAVSGNGPYSPAGFSPAAGLYRWTVSYAGDANNEAASLACNAPNQSSTVGKASPSLSGVATATATAGSSITDSVTLSGGFEADGQLTFRAYGPADAGCGGAVKYEATVTVDGNGPYSPSGFSPPTGVYRWTVSYSGDADNEAASLGCNAPNQTSNVGKASPGLSGTATSAVVVGATITDSATLSGAFQAGGQLTFRAYGPGDATCGGAVKYEASVAVSGNGPYSPAGFATPAAGVYRWTVAYSGDANNEAASLGCNAPNQSSTVAQAAPGLSGVATSTVTVGSSITDNVTLSAGFQAGGQLTFRAYGPDDASCAGAVAYEEAVAVAGNGSYSPPGFSPSAGLYRWTVAYSGDANNEAATLACNAANQASAVGTVTVTLADSATSDTVGRPVRATASIANGAVPTGKITFRAFQPDDPNCAGTPAFSTTVSASGNGSYKSAAFEPTRVGTFRWMVSYSGDPNHAPAEVPCGKATSTVSQAGPSISSGVEGQGAVGKSFRVTATISGGYAPSGTVSFQIYDPQGKAAGCAKLLAVNTVAVAGNGTVRSDPFFPRRPGRYSFVASYSGDTANRAATEPCDPSAHAAQVNKRTPKVRPRARLIGRKQISVRAQLSGASSPSGVVNFRLYGPGDTRCKRKPVFSGGISVRSNGSFLLAEYAAGRRGVYRLSVGYSGDQRNRKLRGACGGAQAIRVR